MGLMQMVDAGLAWSVQTLQINKTVQANMYIGTLNLMHTQNAAIKCH